jgi:hypothetical protein
MRNKMNEGIINKINRFLGKSVDANKLVISKNQFYNEDHWQTWYWDGADWVDHKYGAKVYNKPESNKIMNKLRAEIKDSHTTIKSEALPEK